MIIVHGTIPIKAEQRDRALELMLWMEEASRAELGCITYEFFVGLSDPNTLLLFQEWETAEALAEHFDTDHMERFLKVLPEVLDGEISTRRYAVELDPDMDVERDDHAEPDGMPDPLRRDEKPIIH
ncbi:MAG TPA: putative quinol monooxygenase [Pseudomonadales bacterium]|nr:putative quinol monooxygenase [Pseudomonadales bacterium]